MKSNGLVYKLGVVRWRLRPQYVKFKESKEINLQDKIVHTFKLHWRSFVMLDRLYIEFVCVTLDELSSTSMKFELRVELGVELSWLYDWVWTQSYSQLNSSQLNSVRFRVLAISKIFFWVYVKLNVNL